MSGAGADTATAAPRAAAAPGDNVFIAQLAVAGAGDDQAAARGRRGLSRLAWEIRRRTSIAMSLEIVPVAPESDALFDSPLLAWQGSRAVPALSEAAVARLRQFLGRGGTLLVDAAEGGLAGPFAASVRRELARVLPEQRPMRLPPDQVLYKSFYLVSQPAGRTPAPAYLEGITLEHRLAVVLAGNDLGGAMARDAYGAWELPVIGDDAARERTFRLGVNWAMAALCLDYKEDQVHIPFILQRRR